MYNLENSTKKRPRATRAVESWGTRNNNKPVYLEIYETGNKL